MKDHHHQHRQQKIARLSSVKQPLEGVFEFRADFVAELLFKLFAEFVTRHFGGDLAQAFFVQAASLGAQFQRATAQQWEFNADKVFANLARRISGAVVSRWVCGLAPLRCWLSITPVPPPSTSVSPVIRPLKLPPARRP